jgi:hypothetical protein
MLRASFDLLTLEAVRPLVSLHDGWWRAWRQINAVEKGVANEVLVSGSHPLVCGRASLHSGPRTRTTAHSAENRQGTDHR